MSRAEFAGLITQAGFAGVRFENLSFGISALHTASVT